MIDDNTALGRFASAIRSEGILSIDTSTITAHRDSFTTVEVKNQAALQRSTLSGNSGDRLLQVAELGEVSLTNVTIVDNNVRDAVFVGGSFGIAGLMPFPEIEPNNDVSTPQVIDAGAWNLGTDPNIQESSSIAHLSIESLPGDETADYYQFTVENAGDRTAGTVQEARAAVAGDAPHTGRSPFTVTRFM